MFDAIRNEFAPKHRTRFDRSVFATAGLLFGVAVCGAVGMATGRGPFSLDLPMLTLYASFLPLSVAGFMQHFLDEPPKLPMLATLWFLALFVPAVFFGEVFLGNGAFAVGDVTVPLSKLVGFRVMGAAMLAGLFFGGVRADGSLSREFAAAGSSATNGRSNDWEARHREAVERLAKTNVAIRSSRSFEEEELAAFERRLRQSLADSSSDGDDDAVVLEVEETTSVAIAA